MSGHHTRSPEAVAVGTISSTRSTALSEGWSLVSTPPGAWSSPADIAADARWEAAVVPGTVALSVGPDDVDGHQPYDAVDWWYRFRLPEGAFDEDAPRQRLRFAGLATLAEVWLGGRKILDSTNMFCAHEVDVTGSGLAGSELVICFRSLQAALGERRPRPRWKTKLVESQQLRWFRTTLLGRIPGWAPAIQPVGPWRSVRAESVLGLDVRSFRVRPSIEGRDGRVDVALTLEDTGDGIGLKEALLEVSGAEFPLEVREQGGAWTVQGAARIERPALWWPHTHGKPALHACTLRLETSAGPVSVLCGPVGFRSVEVDRSGGRIQFVVNGVPVFCRGSCWTTNDILSLVGDPARMRRSLELLAEAHGNMVRVGGTMVYETDEFYRACDELGLMVWQDFMFANMDYPVGERAFDESVRVEVEQQLRRLSSHACVVAYCGGSEVEQQAAMFGAEREIWSNALFSEGLPARVSELAPGTPYWPSTPTGGPLPFHVGEGLAHYYGVGAYRRPLEDVRLAAVKFTPECLGISHVPEGPNLRRLSPSGAVPPHDPAWKRGVPRDTGPGWDFEDVRDHYLERLYGVHAVQLRSDDLERYLALSRIVSGEIMEHAFAEWRRDADPCGGALTWFWSDLRPGAGWGVVDSDGLPKPAYHYLRRAWAPTCVRLLDRGLDGLVALLLNERAQAFEGWLELVVVAGGRTVIARSSQEISVPARRSVEVSVEEQLGHFVDSTYSYRFGPPRHEAIVARLLADDGDSVVSEHVYRPVRSAMTEAPAVSATVERGTDGALVVNLASDWILYGVRLDVRGHRASDNHFCLTPGRPRLVTLLPTTGPERSLLGFVEALNLRDAVQLSAPE